MLTCIEQSDVTLAPESPLAQFIDECKGVHSGLSVHLETYASEPEDKTPEERAKVLETTPLFANIHAQAASVGQTAAPSADTHTDLHFTCFVQAPSPPRGEGEMPDEPPRLVELDGRRVGPVDRGECKNLLEVSLLVGLP